jgi:DNA-directed RNA polymerase subunit M/transcription elongation factor TFIIS
LAYLVDMTATGGDVMVCRACGNEERASEGYPCSGCGTFICIVCEIRGVIQCRACEAKSPAKAPVTAR